MKLLVLSLFVNFYLFCNHICAQQPALYMLQQNYLTEIDFVGFTSLSESYPISLHPDSSAIPDLENYTPQTAYHIKLEGEYRKRFLTGTKISESDNVYVYDYSKNVLVTLNVKELDVVAMLNQYASEDDFPYLSNDYMIGFEIKSKHLTNLSEHYSEALVYVGNQNPFAKGQMKPVQWKEIPAQKGIVRLKSYYDETEMLDYTPAKRYQAQSDGFIYTLQELLIGSVSARQLIVTDQKTGKNVCERAFYESESRSPAPLNNSDPEGNVSVSQWTGKLFKDKPLVIFGFEYHSFDCPEITVVSETPQDIYINCDNRH